MKLKLIKFSDFQQYAEFDQNIPSWSGSVHLVNGATLTDFDGFFDEVVSANFSRQIWATWGRGDQRFLSIGTMRFELSRYKMVFAEGIMFSKVFISDRVTGDSKQFSVLNDFQLSWKYRLDRLFTHRDPIEDWFFPAYVCD